MSDFHYFDVEWRFSGTKITFFGLDPIIILVIPFTLFGLAQEFGTLYFTFVIMFAIVCLYASLFTSYKRVWPWTLAQRTKYWQKCEWKT